MPGLISSIAESAIILRFQRLSEIVEIHHDVALGQLIMDDHPRIGTIDGLDGSSQLIGQNRQADHHQGDAAHEYHLGKAKRAHQSELLEIMWMRNCSLAILEHSAAGIATNRCFSIRSRDDARTIGSHQTELFWPTDPLQSPALIDTKQKSANPQDIDAARLNRTKPENMSTRCRRAGPGDATQTCRTTPLNPGSLSLGEPIEQSLPSNWAGTLESVTIKVAKTR